MSRIEQIPSTGDRVDGLRLELEGKVDKKLSESTFFWVMGVAVVVVGGILTFVMGEVSRTNDKMEKLNEKVIVIDTKIGERSNSN